MCKSLSQKLAYAQQQKFSLRCQISLVLQRLVKGEVRAIVDFEFLTEMGSWGTD